MFKHKINSRKSVGYFAFVLLFLFFLAGRVPANPFDGGTKGQIMGNPPIKVDKAQPFDFHIWLKPANPSFDGSVKIFMDNNPKVKYEPQEFTLKAGERQKVRATILNTGCGLAVIAAYADDWEELDTTVDGGFLAKVKTNLNESIESGVKKSCYISFTDENGKPIALDADTVMVLQSSKLGLYDQTNKKWVESIQIQLPFGSSSTPAFDILPDTWASDMGIISVELRSALNYPIYNDNIPIPILPPWYSPLLMAMMGGILYSSFQCIRLGKAHRRSGKGRLRQLVVKKIIPALITGCVSGLLAYLFASWGILGIKVDTTTLKGFVILGIIFSYIGIDLILKTVAPEAKSAHG